MKQRPVFPWLTVQMVAAILLVALLLGALSIFTFQSQSAAYSQALMDTFEISPGALHSMYVDDVRALLWRDILIVVVLSIGLAILLSRLIMRPINQLARRTGEVAGGNYKVRAPVLRGELGRLSDDFNAMVATLDREDAQRRQLITDIAHEVRTPITTIRGYLEGIEDGVFQADAKTLGILGSELDHLTELSRRIDVAFSADSVDPRGHCDFSRACAYAVARWGAPLGQAGLVLESQIAPGVQIAMTETAAKQVLDNLLSNLVKYASPSAPAQLTLTEGGLTVNNAVSDFPDGADEMLFDRFYRVDDSRSRAHQRMFSTGLGLSIVKDIVVAVGGSISARHEAGRLTVEARF